MRSRLRLIVIVFVALGAWGLFYTRGRIIKSMAISGEAKGARVVACKIALDETFLMLVTGDGQGHRVDLRTGKFASYASRINARAWPRSFTRSGADPIGPDADLYFDSDRRVVARFSDPRFTYRVGDRQVFIAFTSAPNQIVVFDRDQLTLQRIEMSLGSKVWTLKIPGAGKGGAFVGYPSPDYAWVAFGNGSTYWLVRAREGSLKDVLPAPKSAGPPQFTAQSMRLSGGGEGLGEHALVTLPRGGRKSVALPRAELLFYEDGANIWLTRAGELKLQGGNLSLGEGIFAASVLNPPGSMVFARTGSAQINWVDLGSKEIRSLGRIYERDLAPERACVAVSSTGRLFAVGNGNQAEIFWSAFVAAENFRSVLLTLPTQN